MKGSNTTSGLEPYHSSSCSAVHREDGEIPTCERYRIRVRRGFTLLEVLIVVAILGIVIAVIGACLTAGMRVWDTARRYSKGEPQLALACAMMERDIVNAFPFYAIQFSGAVDAVSMPVMLGVPDVANVKQVGTVRYYWIKDREALGRKEWVYPVPEPSDAAAEIVAASVVRLQWWYAGASDAPGVWRETWADPSNMPYRVKVEAELSSESGGYRVERIVVRPVTNGVAG